MQNVIDKIELMFAALGAFLGWFFGGFDGFLYALIIFVVMDYFTGILAAGVKHELSSEVGFKGIAKKVCMPCCFTASSGEHPAATPTTTPYFSTPSRIILAYCVGGTSSVAPIKSATSFVQYVRFEL